MIPNGWKNLSPKKHRINFPAEALREIRQVHPTAIEQKLPSCSIYFVRQGQSYRLVGVAWCGNPWHYAVLPASGLLIGQSCSIVYCFNTICISPDVRGKNYIPPYTKPTKYQISREPDGWYIMAETDNKVGQIGPYVSRNEARSVRQLFS